MLQNLPSADSSSLSARLKDVLTRDEEVSSKDDLKVSEDIRRLLRTTEEFDWFCFRDKNCEI